MLTLRQQAPLSGYLPVVQLSRKRPVASQAADRSLAPLPNAQLIVRSSRLGRRVGSAAVPSEESACAAASQKRHCPTVASAEASGVAGADGRRNVMGTARLCTETSEPARVEMARRVIGTAAWEPGTAWHDTTGCLGSVRRHR